MHISFKIAALILAFFTHVACVSTTHIQSGDNEMNNTDKELVIKMILDHPDLQQYLHPELIERVPIKISNISVSNQSLSIRKFNKLVEVVTDKSDNKSPSLDFISFIQEENNVNFEISYNVEGVTIKGIAKKIDGRWSFIDFDVYEN